MKSGHLFSYNTAETPIHRLSALLKLACVTALTAGVFFFPAAALAGATVFLAVSAVIAMIGLDRAAALAKTFAGYSLFIVLVRFLKIPESTETLVLELRDTLLYLWRLFLALGFGTILYATTSALELRNALEDLQNSIYSRLKCSAFLPDIAFSLSLTIAFIPRIFDLWQEINLAWNARGGGRSRSPAAVYRRIASLVPLLLIRLLDAAARTERAIRNRKPL